MGQPVFECRNLILKHGVHVYSPNYSLCGDISRRVMDVLSMSCPEVEVYSIDEAFLNLTGIPGSVEEYCREIRDRVKKWVGLPVSIGIGPTETLAKAASRVAKKSADALGVFDATGSTEDLPFLHRCGGCLGIVRRYARLLRSKGILTGLSLSRVDDEWAKKHLTVMGLRTVFELRDISCIPLAEVEAPTRSIICSRTFGRKVFETNSLRRPAPIRPGQRKSSGSRSRLPPSSRSCSSSSRSTKAFRPSTSLRLNISARPLHVSNGPPHGFRQ